MKFAVIGTDISGMVAAYLLSRRHEVVVFKQDTLLSPQLIASFSPHRVEGTQAKTPHLAERRDWEKLTQHGRTIIWHRRPLWPLPLQAGLSSGDSIISAAGGCLA